jgi:hypothetical protein
MKLLVDPLVETDGPNPLDVARPGSESQSVECVDYLLIGRQLAMVQPRLGEGRRGCNQRQRTSGKEGTSHRGIGHKSLW